MTNAADLYVKANKATADAIRFARDPHAGPLAAMRRRDAATLRAMARAALRA